MDFQCPVSIVMTENYDDSWSIMRADLQHFGHVVTKKEYFRHAQNKRLDEEGEAYARELIKTKASATNIAACLSNKTGKDFTRKDINNLCMKLSDNEKISAAEQVLGDIQDAGGLVRYSLDTENSVDVLFIQTQDMKEMFIKERPRLFQCDTTFGKK